MEQKKTIIKTNTTIFGDEFGGFGSWVFMRLESYQKTQHVRDSLYFVYYATRLKSHPTVEIPFSSLP